MRSAGIMVFVQSLFLVVVAVLFLPDYGLVASQQSKILTVPLARKKFARDLNQPPDAIQTASSSDGTFITLKNYYGVDGTFITLKNYYGLYYTGVISVGSRGQKMEVLYDSASADLWVPSRSLCKPVSKDKAYCKSHSTYNLNCSSTAHTDGSQFKIEYGSGSVNGRVVTDDVTIFNLKIKRQTFGEATFVDARSKRAEFDGIFGLALPGVARISGTPAFFNMVKQGLVAEPVFAFYLGNSTSELVFGGVNPKHYRGRFTFTPVLGNKFWLFQIDSVRVGKKSVTNEAIYATPDSGSSLIIGTPDIIDPINKAIGNSSHNNIVFVDCDSVKSMPVVVLEIGGKQLALTPDDYILVDVDEKDPKSRCVSGFKREESQPVLILGVIFMAKYYTQFDGGKKRIGFAKSRN